MNIHTCAETLTNPNQCCTPNCTNTATLATLTTNHHTHQTTEHTRCPHHTHHNQPDEQTLATKPFTLNPTWATTTQIIHHTLTTHAHKNAYYDKSEGNYQLACSACGHTDPHTWDHHIAQAITNALN